MESIEQAFPDGTAKIFTIAAIHSFLFLLLTQRMSHGLADIILHFVPFIVLGALSCMGAYSLQNSWHDRWYGTDTYGIYFLQYYVALEIHGTAVLWCGPESLTYKYFMTVHHVLSIVAFGCGLVTGRCHFWGNLAGVCETSTVFINIVFLFKEYDYDGFWDKVNNVFLYVSYFITRLILFPFWLYLFFSDLYYHRELLQTHNMFELIYYPATICFLLLFSAFYFTKIHSRTMKSLMCEKEEKKDAGLKQD